MPDPETPYRSPGYSSQYAVARGTRRVAERGGLALMIAVGVLMLCLVLLLT